MSFVERADGIDLPFKCPISSEQVSLRLKIHVPGSERTHAKTIGTLRNLIHKKRADLDLGSNGIRGDVFVRGGDSGVKMSKVLEEKVDGKHRIEPILAPVAQLGFDEAAVRDTIAAVHAELMKPSRGWLWLRPPSLSA